MSKREQRETVEELLASIKTVYSVQFAEEQSKDEDVEYRVHDIWHDLISIYLTQLAIIRKLPCPESDKFHLRKLPDARVKALRKFIGARDRAKRAVRERAAKAAKHGPPKDRS